MSLERLCAHCQIKDILSSILASRFFIVNFGARIA
jgi:hypothetical protein